MNTFPETLDAAVEQAKEATQKAIADGYRLVQVELLIPEIALKSEALALEFAQLFAELCSGVKVMFADTGAASLAKRNWGERPFQVTDMGSRFTPNPDRLNKIATKILAANQNLYLLLKIYPPDTLKKLRAKS